MDNREEKRSVSQKNVILAGLQREARNFDGIKTETSVEQEYCEEKCALYYLPPSILLAQRKDLFDSWAESGFMGDSGEVYFMRDKHIQYLYNMSENSLAGYCSFDGNKPWLYYHVINSLDIMQVSNKKLKDQSSKAVALCETVHGGYGGFSHEYPHVMTTYAAVNTLVINNDFSLINRNKLYHFFMDMKQSDGTFSVHQNGECDTRSTYCAVSVARLTNMITDELIRGSTEFILDCQTYEGGFGSSPFSEAHGGYTFCAVATLTILGQLHMCDMMALEKWLLDRQCELEGGFSGRTNKLVDGCYSWYIGASIELLHNELHGDTERLFDRSKLLQYTLRMEQFPTGGGLRDKPNMKPDLYHTMYDLCGLALVEHMHVGMNEICPIHGINKDAVVRCMEYFSSHLCDHKVLMGE